MYTISLLAAVTLLGLLAAVPAWAQNSVPPTAREAAASPEFAAKLHPTTRPGMNKPRPSAGIRTRRPLPQDNNVIYDNGPINGTTDAWTINFGYIVSDTFVPNTGASVIGFDLGVWEFSGDRLTSVSWSITSGPNSGSLYGSGTVSGSNLTDTFISTNQYGYDIDQISASGLNVTVTSGSTYWVNIFNASVPSGDPVYWDENSGKGCQSNGCPSQAYESSVGTIPSEAFSITGGEPPPPPCFGSGGGLQIIHDFAYGEGSYSSQGVAIDRAGNLFGTNSNGGDNGNLGIAYELSPQGQGWIFTDLYSFGWPPGPGILLSAAVSPSPVIIGPDGALYGTASGGSQNCPFGGCGLVFRLRPAACLASQCGWTESVVYYATGSNDAYDPGNLVFDQAGNLYGTSYQGGAYENGAVFQLTPSPGGWKETALYSFPESLFDGRYPDSLLLGKDGNLYGTTDQGGVGTKSQGGVYIGGVVFQLVPSGGAWTENVIYTGGYEPCGFFSSLVQDSFGNLYGLCDTTGQQGFSVGVFMLSPSNGTWVFSMLYTAPGYEYDPYETSNLAVDAADNLYLAIAHPADEFGRNRISHAVKADNVHVATGHPDTDSPADGGDYWWGAVMVRPPGGNFSNLWYGGTVEFWPNGPLAVDASGNVYGTTTSCGQNGLGTVWKVTP